MTASTTCPACGTDEGHALTVSEMMFGTHESFPYTECAHCGTLRLEAVPDDYSPYYPQDYYSVDQDPERILGRPGVRQFTRMVSRSSLLGRGTVAKAARASLKQRQFQSFLTVLDSIALAGLAHGPATRVLDVGCGSGILVYGLSLAGVSSVVGMDPFAPGDRTFDTGARLVKQDLDGVEGEFDLVMFHHSLEHVLDPRASLARARDLLTADGRILVRMPTVSSEAFDVYREEWVQLDAPRHVTVFSREGLERLCADVGLAVTAVQDDSGPFQFWGSEQVRRGIAMEAPNSYFVDPKASPFSTAEIAEWSSRAEALNAAGRGDQAAWVIRPA